MSTENPKPEEGMDLGPLEPSKGRSVVGLVVAVLIAGGAIGGLLYADYAREQKPMLAQQQDEEFRFRSAQLPEPPRERVAPMVEERRDSVRERAEAERARRENEAAAHAQRLQAEAADQQSRESKAAAEKAERDRKKREQERRRSPMLVSAGRDSGSAGAGGGSSSGTELDPSDAYFAERLAAMNNPQAAAGSVGAAGATPQEQAYSFVPGSPTEIAKTSATIVSADLTRRIRQGKVIPGVLKTAISSDHPGLVTAVVQEDVYSDDGSQVLIPRGSDLIGEYRSGIRRGQSRVFIIWRRLARPDGIDVSIESPGADSLGVAGLEGDVDHHFFERFGSAIVLSFIEAKVEESRDSVSIYTGDAQRVAQPILRDSMNVPPTINVDQGARINVMVARDLYFGAGFGP